MTPFDHLLLACRSGDIEGIRKALSKGADPKKNNSDAISTAASKGHVECVRLLIPLSDTASDECSALRLAARDGHSECAGLLIPVSNPKAKKSWGLQFAAYNGHAECTKIPIPVSDIKAAKSGLKGCPEALAFLDSVIQEERLRNTYLRHGKTRECSVCHTVRGVLPLHVRKWTCSCGAVHDQDDNAAENLRELARLALVASKANNRVSRPC